MTSAYRWAATLLATLGAACQPALDDRPWLITQPRIVGWKAEPPEAPVGANVALQAIALDPAGLPDATSITWTLCRTRKPLDESRVVPLGCLNVAVPDATGDRIQLAIPLDACRLFGPDTPQPAAGASPTRPRDADGTGGYYQPITLVLGASVAVGLERLSCDLPDASLAAARAFQAAYVPNQNPQLLSLDFFVGGAPVNPAAIPSGARVTIQANWVSGSVEPYVLYDRATSSVVPASESLSASWFVTGGDLDVASTTIDDETPTTTTVWHAPENTGTYQLAFIIRDSRGGSDVLTATLIVD